MATALVCASFRCSVKARPPWSSPLVPVHSSCLPRPFGQPSTHSKHVFWPTSICTSQSLCEPLSLYNAMHNFEAPPTNTLYPSHVLASWACPLKLCPRPVFLLIPARDITPHVMESRRRDLGCRSLFEATARHSLWRVHLVPDVHLSILGNLDLLQRRKHQGGACSHRSKSRKHELS